ncbi:hypothetical protein B0J13DRAFT_120796 [Dactylonectria estremocensis]|uniref:Ubiquitin-like domain-containing protein n=1 Tax=Dactylonectria estremocensis TaxID=1079267 RepID=A0A9P9FFE8_9HYPO|nr:hypothetical protein B0J13DRAFT_120796 [Dactylonectria estremocensis]
MGCCFSRSSGPNSPYPGGAPNASSRAINPPPLSLPEPAHGDSPRGASRRHRREQRPLGQHIDKPLRRHEWSSRDRSWTRRGIATERAAFFDTRVTGRSEVWQTIHAALQVLWDPVGQDAHDDGSSGLATAQMILSAAEISLPTGNLVNGVYDTLGNYYQLPEWVVSDPQNLVEEPDVSAKGDASTACDDTTAEDDMTDDDDEIDGRKREKGKEVIDVREMVPLRARLSENGQDINLSIGESEMVKNVARKIAQEAALASTKRIRIAYMGKMLKENSTLGAQGWQTGHVVNALVFNR